MGVVLPLTVVAAFNWFSEVVVIADTRVSQRVKVIRPDFPESPQDFLKTWDCLKKLYSIQSPRSPEKAAVLGFSGDIRAAKTVIVHLSKYKFQNYKRRLVMANLKEELRRWIEEATVSKLEPRARGGLKFMLCGIEPSRHMSGKRRNGKTVIFTVGSLPTSEAHIYIYTVNKDSGKVTVSKRLGSAVIGSGRRLKREIMKKANGALKFGFRHPHLHQGRAFLISHIVGLMFEENQSIKDVGGPFQAIRITPNGLIDMYVWPPSAKHHNVEVRHEGARSTIFNAVLGEEYTLYPVWELPL